MSAIMNVEKLVDSREIGAFGSFFFDDIDLRTTRTNQWILSESLYYYSASHQCIFEVEPGFKTDLASLPRWSRALFDRNGPGKLAAILHDRGYDSGGFLPVFGVADAFELRAFVLHYRIYRTLVTVEGDLLERSLRTLELDRKGVDLLFLEAMGASHVPRPEQLAFYHAVRLGGSSRFG